MSVDISNEIVIRTGVVSDDVEMCVDIWVRSLESRDGAVDAQVMAERVRSAFLNPILRFAVATAPRVGFALVESGRPHPTEALLRFLAVDPDGEGSGIGRALLADAIDNTTIGGFRSLMLEVRTNNERAIELYTRAGFEPFGAAVPHPRAGYPMQPYLLALS
jgi:ribosomal protein S18 acetylase RimI-like enzyme